MIEYHDRRKGNELFINDLARRLAEVEQKLRSIERGVWCLVKTVRAVGAGLFLSMVAVLPEFGKSRGWW